MSLNAVLHLWLVNLQFTIPQLDDEFRYLQKKKNVVKELSEMRLKVYPVVLFSS